MNFDTWFSALKSDEIWYNQICFMYSKKNMKLVAQECFTYLLSKPERFKTEDFRDFRACYQSFLKNSKDDYQAPQLQQVEEKKEVQEVVSWEKRAEYLNKIQEILKGSTMENGMPRLTAQQVVKEGQWEVVKFEPRTEVMKAMILTDHVEKVREARRKTFLHYFPDAGEEELQAYLKKLES